MKLLALDLDGTTVNDKGQITNETLLSIELAKKYHAVVCFVTGRSEFEVESLSSHVAKGDYLIVDTGAKVINIKDRSLLFHRSIEPDEARVVIDHFIKRRRLLHVKSGFYWGVTLFDESVAAFAKFAEFEPVLIRNAEDTPLEKIDSFCVYGYQSKNMINRLIERKGMNLYTLHSQYRYYDILRHDINKWVGVQYLAEHLGIPREDIIAVGNFTNDIEMVSFSGIGVAVKNASDDVKNVADYVTKRSNNENAIGEIVEKFILS